MVKKVWIKSQDYSRQIKAGMDTREGGKRTSTERDWYVDRVLEVAKIRAKIVAASDQLATALEAAEAWRRR